jgi:transposase-like protein
MGMEKATAMVLAQELFEQGLSKSAIARRLGRDRQSIRLWLRGIKQHGQKALLEQSAWVCKVPRPTRQVDALVKAGSGRSENQKKDAAGTRSPAFWKRSMSNP